ncbi:MAG: hypothetical protein Q4B96_05240 [Bacillota bacterium]|nr:hypothetical protein [Bacillota bacterium]
MGLFDRHGEVEPAELKPAEEVLPAQTAAEDGQAAASSGQAMRQELPEQLIIEAASGERPPVLSQIYAQAAVQALRNSCGRQAEELARQKAALAPATSRHREQPLSEEQRIIRDMQEARGGGLFS